MENLLFKAVGVVLQLQQLAIAGILAALFALGARLFVLPSVDRGRHLLVTLLRFAGGALFLIGGALYGLFTGPVMRWSIPAIEIAAAVSLLVLVPLAVSFFVGSRGRRLAAGGPAAAQRGARRPAPPRRWPSPTALLAQLCLLLALLLIAAVTLMRAGFVALTEDRALLMVDVTGETGSESVRWAPPGGSLREERLTTHRVVFRTPAGERVAEAWLYGDQVAVKGKVLRLTPILNAAGVPNLFELQFAHNGYIDAERHNTLPHLAVPLPAMGPLAVHPWWRSLQRRLLERWEKGTVSGSDWAVRSVSTESTYYPLVDAAGQPIRQTFRLVLTPGGLSAS